MLVYNNNHRQALLFLWLFVKAGMGDNPYFYREPELLGQRRIFLNHFLRKITIDCTHAF